MIVVCEWCVCLCVHMCVCACVQGICSYERASQVRAIKAIFKLSDGSMFLFLVFVTECGENQPCFSPCIQPVHMYNNIVIMYTVPAVGMLLYYHHCVQSIPKGSVVVVSTDV